MTVRPKGWRPDLMSNTSPSTLEKEEPTTAAPSAAPTPAPPPERAGHAGREETHALARPVAFSPPAQTRSPVNALLITFLIGAVVWSGAGTQFSFTAPFDPQNVKSVTRFVSGAFPPG